MNYQFECGWHDLSTYLNGACGVRLWQESPPVGYLFLPPERVLDHFVRVYPKHENYRAKLLQKLAETKHMENGMVRVSKASPLAVAL